MSEQNENDNEKNDQSPIIDIQNDDIYSDEQEEEDYIPEEGEQYNEEEEDGEDLIENQELDYVPIPALDRYDNTLLENREYDRMTWEERMKAEEELNARQAQRQESLFNILDVAGGDEDEEERQRRRRIFRTEDHLDEDREDIDVQESVHKTEIEKEVEDEIEVNLEAFDVPLIEWLATERTRRAVKKKFRYFLLDTDIRTREERKKNNQPYKISKYERFIHDLCAANGSSLEVDYGDLSEKMPLIAIWLTDCPREMISILDEVTTETVFYLFPEYSNISKEIHVRIKGLPLKDNLRDLRQVHINSLIRISGVVTRRTAIFPQLKFVCFTCMQCGNVLGPYRQTMSKEVKPGRCRNCENHTSFKLNQQQTVYDNYQKITLQESPGSVPPGRIPRHKDIILLGDLIDRARPGEEIDITGIYMYSYQSFSPSNRSGFPVFQTIIEANHIEKREDKFHLGLTEDDRRAIRKLSRDPNLTDRIIHSIAPSIFGHEHAKTAIAMALFGGVPKHKDGNSRTRGDVNVLLLGDPGTAKSQILKYTEKTAPRAVYTTGKGASAVGLTATVHKDPLTKEWTLEGGALVLADRGVCLIDEFDKMNEGDRTSIHEAMEQQSISVSKAGIVTSLQARCSVIAAANPIGGRYNADITLAENVELSDPILQRFDILCIFQDLVDPTTDEHLANFVVKSHMMNHPSWEKKGGWLFNKNNNDDINNKNNNQNNKDDIFMIQKYAVDGKPIEPISQDLLRKYIMFARTKYKPNFGNEAQPKKIELFYKKLRKISSKNGGVPIAVRHLEAIVRMSEASARMHLRTNVIEYDVNIAFKVMIESFIQSQKISVRRSLRKQLNLFNRNVSDFNELLLRDLQSAVNNHYSYWKMIHPEQEPTQIKIPIEDITEKAKSYHIQDLTKFYSSKLFKNNNFEYVRTKDDEYIVKKFEHIQQY